MPVVVQAPDPELAARRRALGFWRDATIVDDLRRAAVEQPNKLAVVSWRQETDRTETLTYRELAALVDRAAAGLCALGIARGDVVSLQLPNWWEFTVLHLACVRVGAVTHPMSPILGPREVDAQLQAAGSRIVVVAARHRSMQLADAVQAVARRTPSIERVLVAGENLEQTLFEPTQEREDPRDLHLLYSPADFACELQFTSGTQGAPKGVVHTHNSAYASVFGVARALELGSGDTVVMPATFGHQTGFLFGCCLPVMLGATAVLQDVWDPGTMLELADRFRATWTSIPPAMVHDACRAARRHGRARSLRWMRTSGGPVPWGLVAEARRTLGVRLMPSWGLTETGVCTVRSPEENDGLPPTDGRPLPGVGLRWSPGPDSPSGREVAVRSPGLFAGYLEDGEVRPAPRWFATGDLAVEDGRGGIRITGRVKDLIIRGGENIPVAEVEAILAGHEAVAEVAVVAVADQRLGERACAVVVPIPGQAPTLDALIDRLAQAGMAKQFWPEYLLVMSELPRTATGKVVKAEIRELAEARFAQGRRGGDPAHRFAFL